ncbi:MAG: hypothetical protein IKB16_02025 [Lentisphaeria bacterium]|nr:hypothetical protein [Lentisphaeria bacterium]
MKKVIFVIALVFAGAILLSAAEVNINGNFKWYSKKTLRPEQWGLNMNPAQAQQIKLTVTPVEDKTKSNVLTIDCTKGKSAPLRNTKAILCKAGDKITVTADVTVKGSFSFTWSKYGKKGFLRAQGKAFRLLGKKTTVKFETILTEDKPAKELYRVHLVMNFPGGKVSTVENVKVDLIPAAEVAKEAAAAK